MSRFWSRFVTREFKCILVGLNNAGKTTTLYKLHLGETCVTAPTVGSNVEVVSCKDSKVKFQMWDLGGQETLRRSWSSYYANTAAIMLVVDSTDRDRIGIVKEELELMLGHEDLAGAVLCVFANKQDLRGAMPATEVAERLGLHNLKTSWHIQACSALTGAGLDDALSWMATKARLM